MSSFTDKIKQEQERKKRNPYSEAAPETTCGG